MESSGWELHKENIQPLCSGRNISLLKQSLDTSKSMADHEQDIEQQLSELESNIQNYSGDDPIEPYLALIRFLEHQCVQTITWKKSLSNARMECYKKFYDSLLYKNDKRYVEAIVKCLNDAVPDTSSRLNLLLVALNKKEIGTIVSQMYIVIADHQESLGMKNEARQTIKRGIMKDAQPNDKLQEAISELEFRIARDLAKSMNVGPQQSSSRNFGSSVPVHGEKNDAPVFRNDLKPAIPVMERQTSIPKLHKVASKSNVPLYQNETENDHPTGTSSSSSSVGFNVVEQVVGPKFDKENHQKPSKWNKPNVEVETDSPEMRECETPREKIAIYTEDSIDDKPPRPVMVQEGVLKERKPCSLLGPELQATSSLAGTVSNKQSADADVKGTADILSTIELAPMIIPNACLKFSRSMLPSGRPASFEHRKRNAWLKSNQDREIIARLKNDKMQLEEKLIKVERDFEQLCEVEESLRENFETELKQKAIKEAQWEQQRYSYNDAILRLTTECSELKDYVQQLELHQKKFTNILEEAKTHHWQELEELKANHASQIKELTLQLQQQYVPHQASTTRANNLPSECNSNSAGDRQYSSSSNENECTYINAAQQQQQQQQMSISHYSPTAVPTDKLMNATGMSYRESFMAPPSHVDQTPNNLVEISINRDPSFNASVRMSGATTVYGWNEKSRFCLNTSDGVDEDSPITNDTNTRIRDSNATKNDTAPSFGAVMLPPPSVSKKFVLYESISDSNSTSKWKKPDYVQPERPQGIDFRCQSENIAPAPHPVLEIDPKPSDNYVLSRRSTSVSARIAEIEAISTAADVHEEMRPIRHSRDTCQENLAAGIVGQTFVRPAPRRSIVPLTERKDEKFNDDDDEPPFEPYVGRSRPSLYEPYRPPELPFDTSNLTSALQFGPPPLLNSTPERFSGGIRRLHSDRMFDGNYVHTQRIPSMTDVIGEIDGPMSPENEARRIRERENVDWMQDRMQRLGEIRDHPIRDINESMQLNLSPIQETSKENRSGCTTSSSSGNMTSTRGGATISGFSMCASSRSVSGGQRSTSSYRFTTQN